ncbi:site-specific integrase [Pseudactinotalea terrae]|uniref:site-specific integrase n=1 Tax=Pseudactinotalea terrae TaxID=1743262 RepID=UPI0013911643|nr:site-specific integrase [Pseudactinotalea terrae]
MDTNALLAPADGELELEPARVAGGVAERFATAALADRTWEAYRSDWQRFEAWAAERGVTALPADPAVVADYLAAAADLHTGDRPVYSAATISRWCSAINAVHRMAGHSPVGQHPTVAVVLAGIRRTVRRARPTDRKAPLLLGDLVAVLDAMPARWPCAVAATRDRALLLAGFAGAFRRSELTALTVADLTWHRDDGLHVLVRYAKNDQDAHGQVKALPTGSAPATCPVCAMVHWLRLLAAPDRRAAMRAAIAAARADAHACRTGLPDLAPTQVVFPVLNRHGGIGQRPLTGHGINRVVKDRAAAAGLSPERLGAHSLRAGFVTQATRSGASVLEIMRQTGHRDPASVEGYVREHDPLQGNAVTRLGL